MKWPENLEKLCTAGRWPWAQPKVAVMLAKSLFILIVLTGTVITFCHQEKQKPAWKSAQQHIPVLWDDLAAAADFQALEFTWPYSVEATNTKDSTNLWLVEISIHVKDKELQLKQ